MEEGGAGFKRLVLFRFKEGIAVEEMLNGMKKLVSEIDLIKSAEWGAAAADVHQGASKGFTHALVMGFENQEDCSAFMTHPAHVESGPAFLAAVDDFLGINYSVLPLK